MAQATSTPEPIFKTATPHPTGFYTCPEFGEMEGYLTETPSVSWMNNCSWCLSTQQTEPTPMPTLEGTPGTPAPTFTQTSVPGGGLEPGIQDIVFFPFGDGVSWNVWSNPGYTLISGYGTFSVAWEGKAFRDWWGDPEAITCNLQCQMLLNGNPYWNQVTTVNGNFSGGFTIPQSQSIHYEGNLNGHCWLTSPCVDEHSYLIVTQWTGSGLWALSGPEPPVPSPTPNYSECGSISGGGGSTDPFNAEDIFTIPVPALGEASCIVLMPSFSIPTTAINIIPGINIENDLDFPGVTLCVRPLTLGNLVIMGMVIDLDFYAVLVGAMMILRKILRS